MDCYAIAGAKSAVQQMAGHAADGVSQLAIRDAAFVGDDGGSCRLLLGVFDQRIVEQHGTSLEMNTQERQK